MTLAGVIRLLVQRPEHMEMHVLMHPSSAKVTANMSLLEFNNNVVFSILTHNLEYKYSHNSYLTDQVDMQAKKTPKDLNKTFPFLETFGR